MKEATGAHFSFWYAHLAKESGQISDSRVWGIVVNIETIETRVLSQREEERGKRLGTSVSSPESPSERDDEGGVWLEAQVGLGVHDEEEVIRR